MKLSGDLIPSSSGLASLGVNQSPGSNGDYSALDATDIRPFNRIHVVSGIWHDELLGQSGVIRYSRSAGSNAGRFQASVDGGLTFDEIATAANAVTSVGVINGANLSGDVDLSPTTSGFINITDNAGSPISFSVDVWGLSGLYRFPSPNGFSNMGRFASADFSLSFVWNFNHGLNSSKLLVQAWDASATRAQLIPDEILIIDDNNVRAIFNPGSAGRLVVGAL